MNTIFLTESELNNQMLTHLKRLGLNPSGFSLSYYQDNRNRNKLRLEFTAVCTSGVWIKIDSLVVQNIDFEERGITFYLYSGIENYVNNLADIIYKLNQ